MESVLFIVQIILAVALILLILLQVKGQGFSGSFGGDSSSIYRTRRGVEKSLFQFTVVLSIVFLAIAVFTSVYVS